MLPVSTCMAGDFVRIYDLERDRAYIESVQAATVRGGDFALRRDHGIFGSREWWAAVESGAIETLRTEGVISRLYRNVQDWPEFEIDAGGNRSTWSLDGETARYRVGVGVRIDYVMQAYEEPPAEGESAARVVLGIWVEA